MTDLNNSSTLVISNVSSTLAISNVSSTSVESFKSIMCIGTEHIQFDRISFSLDYIIENDNNQDITITSESSVFGLMHKSEKRYSRRAKKTKTKKTHFKYFTNITYDFSQDKDLIYNIDYQGVKYQIIYNKMVKSPLVNEGGIIYPIQIKIKFNERKDLYDLLNFSNKIYFENYLNDDLEDYNKITMYIFNGDNYWESNGEKQKRDFDSIYLPIKIKKDIIKGFELFENEAYIKRLRGLGITRKKVLFLDGAPGTGKSSLILAIASQLNKDIAYFSFTPKITDTTLITAMSNVPEDAIVVFEDIDCLFQDRKPNDSEKNYVTFSALLNCLDGLVCKDGMIVIATTNHLNTLDPALIRSGRVDKIITLDYIKKKEIIEMFKRFMELNYIEGSENEFYDKVHSLSIKITPSLLQQYLKKYMDKTSEALENYLEIKEMHEKVNKSDKHLYS